VAERTPLRRRAASPEPEPPPPEIIAPTSTAPTFPSGCTLLDLGLGGGWAIGRAVNVVGDTSAGKTLVAIEAFANHALRFKGKNARRYNEAENALNHDYARSVGLPPDTSFTGDEEARKVDQRGSRTVEDFDADFRAFLAARRSGPCLYALDSCDALSVKAELDPKHKLGDATRLAGKAALLSEFFRTHIADIDAAQCTLMIVSQIRDNIGVMFGPTQVRTGGRALDFYSTQIVWFSTPKPIKARASGVERVVGSRTIFHVKKNKIAGFGARAAITIHFNYGIDDEVSCIEWLEENKLGAAGPLTVPLREYRDALEEVRGARDFDTIMQMRAELQRAVRTRWAEIEAAMAPRMRKYAT
jgi:recombination protein RecA